MWQRPPSNAIGFNPRTDARADSGQVLRHPPSCPHGQPSHSFSRTHGAPRRRGRYLSRRLWRYWTCSSAMLLSDLVLVSGQVATTSSRREKIDRLAALLRMLAPGEVAIGVDYLTGSLRQGRIGLGWAALSEAAAQDRIAAAESPSLT